MTNVHQISKTSTPSTEVSPILRELIEKLFDQMLLSFGKRFVDQWSAADPSKLIDHWAEKLSGYTPREFKAGVATLDNLEWPPTVNQFKKLCRPDVDLTTAYYEALAGLESRLKGEMGVWSHPAVYWAAQTLRHDLQMQTYSVMKSRWEAELNKQMAKSEWPEIPPAVKAIVAPGKSELSREKATQMLDQLGASGVFKRNASDTQWYKKILSRIQRGDKTVTLIQRQFAEQAAAAHGYRC